MAHKAKTRLLECGECGRVDADIVFRSPLSVIAQRLGTIKNWVCPWLFMPACPTCHSEDVDILKRRASIAK